MAPQRTYTLPADQYHGEVAGVRVRCSESVEDMVRDLENPELKKLLEDASVQAALQRGYSNVLVRSIPHSTTLNVKGERVPSYLHITVTGGERNAAHIPCYGLDGTAPNWYTNMTFGDASWEDRVKSDDELNEMSAMNAPSPS
ncbi:hypothetical protein K505DRAFT_342664, partial [Melanomma pulvis-pyrius CBS 109.77]